MERLKNKVALVTGGGSGIGRASALRLASEGAAVVIGNRNEQAGEETVQLIKDAGGKAVFLRTDVTKESDVKALVDHAVSTFGGLRVAFNNAGVEGGTATALEDTEENYRFVFDVNVLGVILSMKHELAHMLEHGGGSIINNASIAGHIGFPQHGIYVATKHAVLGLTRTAALENAAQGVRVNAVSPGGIETDMLDRFTGEDEEQKRQMVDVMTSMHPIGRLGKPEEIAHAVAWLASDDASFVVGQSILVDGGFTAI